VLAVGDAQFQKKCLGKMEAVGKEGRTVIFVSHNMSAIEALCSRAVVLKNGEVLLNSYVEQAVSCYLDDGKSLAKDSELRARTDRQGSGDVLFVNFAVKNEQGEVCEILKSGGKYTFIIECFNKTEKQIDGVVISLDMFDEKDNYVMLLRSNFENTYFTFVPGVNLVQCTVDSLPYTNGNYTFSLFMSRRETDILDFIKDASSSQIDGGNFFINGSNGLATHCKFLLRSYWTQNSAQEAKLR